MTNIGKPLAILLGSALLLSPLTACGSAQPYAPAAASRICLGPEVPDDLEDLYDRDVVRFPDAACDSGDPLYGYALVNASDVPPIGEEVGDSYGSSYRRDHALYLHDSSYRRSHRPKVYVPPSSFLRPRPGSHSGGIKNYTPAPRVAPVAKPSAGASKPSSAPAAPVPPGKPGAPSKANTAPNTAPQSKAAPAPAPKVAPKPAPAPAPKPATKSGK